MEFRFRAPLMAHLTLISLVVIRVLCWRKKQQIKKAKIKVQKGNIRPKR